MIFEAATEVGEVQKNSTPVLKILHLQQFILLILENTIVFKSNVDGSN